MIRALTGNCVALCAFILAECSPLPPSGKDGALEGRPRDAAGADGPGSPNAEFGADATRPPAAWSFTPSNLPADLASLTASDELLIGGETCGGRSEVEWSTDDGALTGCGLVPAGRFQRVRQVSGEELSVIALRSLRLQGDVSVRVRGTRPLVLLVLTTVIIDGSLQASALGDAGLVGGASGRAEPKARGAGPGGGNAGAPGGGGGGSYCGRGGAGGPDHLGIIGNFGGSSYGTARLVPLRGGSSGGNGGIWPGGGGGGAIQIVAGQRIQIGMRGSVDVGGGGGEREGAGGGSGGAILLEAPSVVVEGVLAANGGGAGSSGQFGENATANDKPAMGGGPVLLNAGEGGAGAAGANVDGGSGRPNPDFANGDFSGGGGGGVGYIRINANEGGAAFNGVMSPGPGTPCWSLGALAGP